MWGQRSCRKGHEGVELELSEGEALKEEITHEKAPGQEASVTFEKPRQGPHWGTEDMGKRSGGGAGVMARTRAARPKR